METPYNLSKSKPGAGDPETKEGKKVAMYDEMIDQGRLGLQAGHGFYKYDEDGNKIE